MRGRMRKEKARKGLHFKRGSGRREEKLPNRKVSFSEVYF
jgi:hypothetical protein